MSQPRRRSTDHHWIRMGERSRVVLAILEYPFEVLIAIAAVLGSIGSLASAPPASIQNLLTPPFQVLWNAYLLVGGFLIMSGLFLRSDRRPVGGIRLEKSGLFAVGLGSLVYAMALLLADTISFYAFFTLLGLGIACFLRIAQVNRYVNTLRMFEDVA